MGRLAGCFYQEVIKKLRKFDFEFYRLGKEDYEIWINLSIN